MLTAKKKISKKQIKEDKLVTSYYKFQELFVKYQAKILIGVGALAVIVVAVILYMNKLSSDNQTASSLLSKVVPLYEAGNYKDAINGQKAGNIKGLKEIVDSYGGSEPGNLAKIYLANAYSVIGSNDAAYEAYNDYSGSNELLKATALAGMAGVIESKKEYEKAADLFKDAAMVNKTNPANAEYLLKAGIAYLKAGNKEDAKTMFETIQKDYKNLASYYEIDKYLIQVKM